MGCPSQCTLNETLVFSICTHDPDTGVLTDADEAPAYRLYEVETAVPILTGSMATLDGDNTTGFYTEAIACTVANGFEDGKSYTIYITATVDGDTGGISYAFKVDNLKNVLMNRLEIAIADGTTAIYDTAGNLIGSVSEAYTEDLDSVNRKRMVP